eukprot:TRINITY_DN5084_c0_g1_i1.p2 TRINITY_DN5084_c0_g1~~TRINITY_DN5084_c0_g1_i1.p2  ORF type:complete len:317 (+),score=64.62 TRINITY_DN5084_c0_g1_i1:94-951(+)
MPKRKIEDDDGCECEPSPLKQKSEPRTWLQMLQAQETGALAVATTEPPAQLAAVAAPGSAPIDAVDESVLTFLTGLTANTTREWFQAHKHEFDAAQRHMLSVAPVFLRALHKIDPAIVQHQPGAGIVSRIYRDLRRTKDPTPYRTEISLFTARTVVGKNTRLPGYYFIVRARNESLFGGGLWWPTPAQLAQLRAHIQANPQQLRDLLAAPLFVETFGSLTGAELTTAPRGVAKNDPNLDLLRKTEFMALRRLSDSELTDQGLGRRVERWAEALRPFMDFLFAALA